jgi:uracil-DNA glycosylase
LQEKGRSRDGHAGLDAAAAAIAGKLQADLRDLRAGIEGCRRCAQGGGLPGSGEAGADIFLLAGRPGPGAGADNPWGSWRDDFLDMARREWGDRAEGLYFSTALRCTPRKVTRAELRRCAPFLAEELFLVGPRLVIVSGKVAAVALREALGDAVPGSPKAGDDFGLFSMRFLFELDVARIGEDRKAAEIFRTILSSGVVSSLFTFPAE